MRFVVTGAAGHVSRPLTELLLARGHKVTVVGRKPENMTGLVKLGAKAAVGDIQDVPFLSKAFQGADGVYLMVPPRPPECRSRKRRPCRGNTSCVRYA
jgi:uncharacterized protein YbjT (DUF2867 family)